MNKLTLWYAGLARREQKMVGIGGIVVALMILVFGIIVPLQSAGANAQRRNDSKRDDLAWMREHAAEIRSAGNQLTQDTGEAPVVLVDRIGRESGLAEALRGTQPSGSGVRVQLEAAPFDTLVAWLDALDQRYGFAVESISVDRAAKPGMVNASVTFSQPRR